MIMVKAISTACFNCETEAAAKAIKDLGAKNAEIAFKTFYEYRPEFSKRLAPEIQGLNIVSVRTFAPNFEHQLFSSSRRVRGDGFYWLDQVMRSMQLLGATRYCFQGAPFGGELTPERVADSLREVASFCSRYGVSVCLENDGVSAPSFYGKIRELCPEISFSLNLSKARLSGYPAGMFAAEMGQSVAQAVTADEEISADFDLILSKNEANFARFLKR